MEKAQKSKADVNGIFVTFSFGFWASLVAQWWRIHLLMQEMHVQSLGWENPLEQEMATHSSMDREAWQARVYGVTKRVSD